MIRSDANSFMLALDNVVFDDFTRKLNAANASKYIQGLKEMYIDFLGKN